MYFQQLYTHLLIFQDDLNLDDDLTPVTNPGMKNFHAQMM